MGTFSKTIGKIFSAIRPAANPKSLLEKRKEYRVGDFVAIDNNKKLKVYVVSAILNEGKKLKIQFITMNEAGEDFCMKEICVKKSKLLYLGDSFVSLKSPLWNLHEELINQNEKPVPKYKTCSERMAEIRARKAEG